MLLIDSDNQPKVTDFGLAKQVESESDLTRTGAVMGTPSYMPPEQAAGKTDEIAEPADVYSLGAILYCLITGRPPFQAANAIDTLMQVLEKEPVAPRSLNPEIPKDLETLCLKCLNKEPVRRYKSAGDLSEDLGRFLSGEPVIARPVGRIEHTWRWCRRKPIAAALVVSLAVLLLTLGVGGPWVAIKQKQLAAEREEQRKRAERNEQIAQAEKSAALKLLFESDTRLAQQEWSDAQHANTVEILQRHQTETVNQRFAWNYLWRQAHSELLRIDVGSSIESLTFSPDGMQLFAGCGNDSLRAWQSVTGVEDFLINLPDGDIRLQTLGENRLACLVRGAGTLNQIDLATQEISQLTNRVVEFAFHPNGKSLAVIERDAPSTVKLLDVPSRETIHSFPSVPTRHPDVEKITPSSGVLDIEFSPDGKLLAIASFDRVDVWNVVKTDAPRRVRTLSFGTPMEWVIGMSFAPESKLLAVSAGPELKIWNVEDGKEVTNLSEVWAEDVLFDPTGRYVALGLTCPRQWRWDGSRG